MRLSEELRARTKDFASAVIHSYVKLPKDPEETKVLEEQLDELMTILTSTVAKLRKNGI